jgi:hypothetical protein
VAEKLSAEAAHPSSVRESYEGDSSTSRLLPESASRNVSLERLSVEEAEEGMRIGKLLK